MQDRGMLAPDDGIISKQRKKKASTKKSSPNQVLVDPVKPGKASKKGFAKEVSPFEKSIPTSLPDSSNSGDEYRALRRKYLLLEEENFGLGRELKEIEDEISVLEGEKLALLDELVVLEGLVDPSEVQSQAPQLR